MLIRVANRYTGQRITCEKRRETKTTLTVVPVEGYLYGKPVTLRLRNKGTDVEHYADDYTGYQFFSSWFEPGVSCAIVPILR